MHRVVQITPDVNPETVKEHSGEDIELVYRPCKTEDEIIERARDGEGIISIYEPMTERVMEALPNLKYICLASIGHNAVDVAAAKERGIAVSVNPDYCVNEVADHTLALALTFHRRICDFQKVVKEEKKWDYNAFGNTFRRMASLTVGLIGLGHIGRAVAKRFRVFGCRVIACDPYVSEEVFREAGAERVSMEEIRWESDIISLHLPLTKETEKIGDREFFSGCKKSPLLINVSRGGLLDQQAIRAALEEDLISGLALDVLEEEEPDLSRLEFLDDPRVLLTPHVAFYSRESVREGDANCGKYVTSYFRGETEGIPLL